MQATHPARWGFSPPPEVLVLLVVACWASTFVVTKALFAELSPLAFTFPRFLIILALAFIALAHRARRDGPGVLRVQRRDLPLVAASGLCGYTLYQLGFVLGLDRTSPFSSSLLIAMLPLFTLVYLALLGEPTPLWGWVGLGVALVGVALFLAEKAGQAGTLVGDLLSLGAGMSFAAYGVLNRPLVRRYPAETYTAYTILAGVVPLLLVSAPAALAQDWSRVSPASWLGLAYMATLPVYVAYMAWNWAIRRRGADAVSRFSLLTPILAGALSGLLAGEPFPPLKLAGAALVLVGLVLPRLAAGRGRPRPSASGPA